MAVIKNYNKNMGISDLDNKVLNFIKNLLIDNEKISIRKIAKGLSMENSLRSVQLSIERLKENWKLFINFDWKIELLGEDEVFNIKTRLIPLIWDIACWWPILAQENIDYEVPISEDIVKSHYNYFLLRTVWDSMNKDWIDDGDVILVRQQSTCNNWDIVVALIDEKATLKEFRKENWIVKLIPHSTNPENKTIIVTENLIIQGAYERNLGKI